MTVIEKAHARAARQLDCSLSEARRSYYPGLGSPVVPLSGKDLLYRGVAHAAFVVLALNSHRLAPRVQNQVYSLVARSAKRFYVEAERPVHVGHEAFELRATYSGYAL